MNTYNSPSLTQASVGTVWNPQTQYLPVRTSRLGRLKTITRSLLRAGLGGAIGGYALAIGLVIGQNRGFIPPAVVIVVFMFLAMVLGLVTGTLTLILENLIEEDLEMFPRAIATSIFSFLALLAWSRITESTDISIVRQLLVPAIVFGFPVGLLSGSRLRIRQLLRHGVYPKTHVASYSFWSLLSDGVAIILRTSAIAGILSSIAALVILWRSIELPERMVLIYCLYYFTLSATVTIFVRSTVLTVLAGLFLNSLLIFLALFWESSSEILNSGGLQLSCAVFGGLWLVFMVNKRTTREERVLVSELGR